jgi:hypothetical protein
MLGFNSFLLKPLPNTNIHYFKKMAGLWKGLFHYLKKNGRPTFGVEKGYT